jgi:hypothetical protein
MEGLRSFIVLPIVLLLNQVDLTNPNVAQLFVIGYTIVLSLTGLTLLYVYFHHFSSKTQRYSKINKENKEDVEVITEASLGKPSQKLTQKEYDLAQLKELATKTLFPGLISFFIWYKWEAVRHFGIQIVMTPMTLIGEKIIKIHLLGYSAVNDLQRPFKVEQNWMQNWIQEKTEGLTEDQEKEKEKDKKKKK